MKDEIPIAIGRKSESVKDERLNRSRHKTRELHEVKEERIKECLVIMTRGKILTYTFQFLNLKVSKSKILLVLKTRLTSTFRFSYKYSMFNTQCSMKNIPS